MLTYAVVHTPRGWTLFEDGLPIETRDEKPDVVEVGHLMTLAVKAAGGKAKLLVQDRTGRLEAWDLDHAHQQLAAIFQESGGRKTHGATRLTSSSRGAPSPHA